MVDLVFSAIFLAFDYQLQEIASANVQIISSQGDMAIFVTRKPLLTTPMVFLLLDLGDLYVGIVVNDV